MYKLLKDKGGHSPVIIKNTDTNATVMIGKISIEILKILEDAEIYMTGKDKLTEEWSINITKDTATKLSELTMKMKKPIRNKTNKTNDNNNDKETKANESVNKNIDAMDVLLGLAEYI